MWFLLVTNSNFGLSPTVFEILTLKPIENGWFFSPHPYLTPPLGEPIRISGWNLPRKTRGMGLPYGENFIILTWTVFVWYIGVMDGRTDGRDGQTDGQAIAYSALSIYVICCSALKILFLFIIAVNTSVLTFITDGRTHLHGSLCIFRCRIFGKLPQVYSEEEWCHRCVIQCCP